VDKLERFVDRIERFVQMEKHGTKTAKNLKI
jgi:hypothetical protein